MSNMSLHLLFYHDDMFILITEKDFPNHLFLRGKLEYLLSFIVHYVIISLLSRFLLRSINSRIE